MYLLYVLFIAFELAFVNEIYFAALNQHCQPNFTFRIEITHMNFRLLNNKSCDCKRNKCWEFYGNLRNQLVTNVRTIFMCVARQSFETSLSVNHEWKIDFLVVRASRITLGIIWGFNDQRHKIVVS